MMTSQEISKTEIFNKKCSAFVNSKKPNPVQTISIKEWFECCKSIQIKNVSDICREEFRMNGKSDRYDELKGKVNCATLSGTFSYRSIDKLIENNGLLVIDIDHPNMDLNELKEHIISFFGDYIFSISISLSGDGLYCIVPIDIDKNRKKLFNKIQNIFLSKDIKIDGGCKDITRLRIMSFDDNVWFNPNEMIKVFNEELESSDADLEVQERQFTKNHSKYEKEKYNSLLYNDRFCYIVCKLCIEQFNMSTNQYSNKGNYCDWWSCIVPLTLFGAKGLDLAIRLSQNSSGYKDINDVTQKFNECSKSNLDRRFFLRYFNFIKTNLGYDWIKQIKNKYGLKI